MDEDMLRAELLCERTLVREAGDGEDRDVGVQRPEDRDREQAQRSAAVDQGCIAVGRVMENGVQAHSEGVAEDRLVIAHVVGNRDALGFVSRHVRREATRGLTAVAVMDAGGDRPVLEVLALCQLAPFTPVAEREAAWQTGEPRIQEHAVSDRLIARIDEILGQPELDPHGDPIPTAHGRVSERRLPTLIGCPTAEDLRVVRVRDQGRDFLRLLDRRGVVPGSRLRLVERDVVTEMVTLDLEAG